MIDKSKQYRTRDGREVRIYATDGIGHQCIHGAYRDIDGAWCMWLWSKDGEATIFDTGPSNRDLIEIRPRIQRTVWVNVYPSSVSVWGTKRTADQVGRNLIRLACVKVEIDCEEGDGL